MPSEKFKDNSELRIIPYMLSQENIYFSLKDSTFSCEKYKASSARQIFFSEFKINNSFTLENSFFKKFKPVELDIL